MSQRNRGDGVTVGVDVGGTSTRVVVFDREGRAVGSSCSATPQGPLALVRHLTASIEAEVAAVDGRLACVGVGVPGLVRDGTVTMALNVGVDGPLALGSLLADRLGVPVRIENDVNAAALGMHRWLGAAPGSSLAYISIGTGFAAGFVIDGTIVCGAFGSAGEIGHIPYPGHASRCVCGQTGCLETVVSGRVMTARMAEVGLEGGAVGLWRAADDGHTGAATIRNDVVAGLAWSCQLVGLLVDVERIGVGGGVGIALGGRLIDSIRTALAQLEGDSAFLAAMRLGDRLVAAPLGAELGALGAARAARRATPPMEPAP